MPTSVHLVRHGEVHNPDKILYGRMDGFRLSDRGQQMADLVAAHFAACVAGGQELPIATTISSPLLRAQQTAQAIAGRLATSLNTDHRLIEAGNDFEGTTMGSRPLGLLNPKWWPKLRNPVRPSWGEPYVDMAERMTAAIRDARDAHIGQGVVLVSHQLPIWVARLSHEGKRLWGDPRRRQCSLCSVTTLDFRDDGQLAAVRYAQPAAQLAASLSADAWSVK